MCLFSISHKGKLLFVDVGSEKRVKNIDENRNELIKGQFLDKECMMGKSNRVA